MKRKKTYLLGFLVLLVWGTIGYKIYQSIMREGQEEDTAFVPSIVRDTTELINYKLTFSYADPFLKDVQPKEQQKLQSSTRHRMVKVKPVQPVTPASTVVNWSGVEYKGFLFNADRRNRIAIVTIHQTDYFLQEGEQAQGFLVEAIESDSLKLRFNEFSAYVQKQKPN